MAAKLVKVAGTKYAGIYQRAGKFSFWVKIQDDAGRWVQEWHSGYSSKGKALAAREKLLVERREGRHVRRSELTVEAYLAEWLDGLSDVREATVHGYRKNVQYINQHIGKVPLQSLRTSQINALYTAMSKTIGRGKKPLSPRTIEHTHATLRRALRDAVRQGLISSNPATDTTRPRKIEQVYEPPWTGEQVGAFLKSVEAHEHRAAFTLICTTGARRSEIAGLKWGDVDLDAGRVYIRRGRTTVGRGVVESVPKNRSSIRNLRVSAVTVDALRQHRDELMAAGFQRVADDCYVFQADDGEPIHPDVLSRSFKAAVKRAGLPTLTVHGLRHMAAALMLKERVPVEVVAAQLGHSNPAVTLSTYRHLFPSEQEDAMNALDRAIYGQNG